VPVKCVWWLGALDRRSASSVSWGSIWHALPEPSVGTNRQRSCIALPTHRLDSPAARHRSPAVQKGTPSSSRPGFWMGACACLFACGSNRASRQGSTPTHQSRQRHRDPQPTAAQEPQPKRAQHEAPHRHRKVFSPGMTPRPCTCTGLTRSEVEGEDGRRRRAV